MTLSEFSDFAQILAAIAVIPSLIFVGLQMRQNTRAVRATMSQAHAATYQEMMGRIYASAELTRIYMTGAFHPEKLDQNDLARFLLMLAVVFRFFDASYTQYLEGQLPGAQWQSLARMLRDNNGNQGFRLWWERRKGTLSDAFRTWYEAQDLAASEHLFDRFETNSDNGEAPA